MNDTEPQRRKSYMGWPCGSAYLNRWAAQYGGRPNAAAAIWRALTTPLCTAFGSEGYKATWAELAHSRDGVAEIHFGTAKKLRRNRVRKRKTVRAREALAWLLITKLIPFDVPDTFTAKIREDPEDDLPWIALADELEYRGEPGRADEIRMAVEQTRPCPLPLLPDA